MLGLINCSGVQMCAHVSNVSNVSKVCVCVSTLVVYKHTCVMYTARVINLVSMIVHWLLFICMCVCYGHLLFRVVIHLLSLLSGVIDVWLHVCCYVLPIAIIATQPHSLKPT